MTTNPFAPVLTLFATLFLFVAGCNAPNQKTPAADQPAMTAERKQAIEQEMSALMKTFFQHVEQLDIEQCMTYFADSPDFLAVNPDGTSGDYAALKKLNADGFAQLATFRVSRKKEVVRVLGDSLALYTWLAGQTGTLKTGQKIAYDNVAGTMLFSRIDGTWKATFYHESALPPVAAK